MIKVQSGTVREQVRWIARLKTYPPIRVSRESSVRLEKTTTARTFWITIRESHGLSSARHSKRDVFFFFLV